jgi:hypothetical protein
VVGLRGCETNSQASAVISGLHGSCAVRHAGWYGDCDAEGALPGPRECLAAVAVVKIS